MSGGVPAGVNVTQDDRDFRAVILKHIVNTLDRPCGPGDMIDDRQDALDCLIAHHRLAILASAHPKDEVKDLDDYGDFDAAACISRHTTMYGEVQMLRVANSAFAQGKAATSTPPIEGPTAQSVYEAIKHGDAEHCAWLDEALAAIWRGEEVPPPRGKGTDSPPIEGRDADVERVAESMWNASPYYDGTDWDHVSLRRYQGTSSTREMYLTLARAALQALGERG